MGGHSSSYRVVAKGSTRSERGGTSAAQCRGFGLRGFRFGSRVHVTWGPISYLYCGGVQCDQVSMTVMRTGVAWCCLLVVVRVFLFSRFLFSLVRERRDR